MPHPTATPVTPTPVALVAPTWDDPLHTWGDPGAMWNGWVPTGGVAIAVDDYLPTTPLVLPTWADPLRLWADLGAMWN